MSSFIETRQRLKREKPIAQVNSRSLLERCPSVEFTPATATHRQMGYACFSMKARIRRSAKADLTEFEIKTPFS